MRVVFLTLFIFTHCTFGSVGNKQEEDAILLESIIRIIRDMPASFQVAIHSYDNQVDDDLSLFPINSGGSDYSVKVQASNSYLDIDRLESRFNPPEKPFGSFSIKEIKKENTFDELGEYAQSTQAIRKTHTPYTVPLDLPMDDPYGQLYTVGNKRIDSFMTGNDPGFGTGTISRHLYPVLNPVPQGVLASTNFYIKRWDIQAIITRVSDSQTRILRLSIRDFHITILPRCKIEVPQGEIREWRLGLNYSRLFFGIEDIFLTGSNGDVITVTDLDTKYTRFLKNLQSEDQVILQESCFL